MKKLLFLFFFFSSSLVLLAQENCRVQDELPLKLMSAEIKRSIKTFKKLKPPVYYLSYTYEDTTRQTLLARQGALYSRGDRTTAVSVFARAGSPKMDNTRPLKGGNAEGENSLQVKMGVTPFDDNPLAFKMALWSATQNMAEKAQEGFARVQINSKTASVRQDDSDDFVLPPASMYCHEQEPQSFDLEKIGELLNEVSTLVRGNKFVQDSNFSFSLEQGHRYFTDSVGTQLKTPVLFARLSYNLINLLDDGSELYRFRTYDVINENQLPTKEQLLADVRQSLEELEKLSKAPEADPITVPAILKNRAMAVFVHEVLGHRVEGHRQKLDSFGKTFTSKVGQLVTAPFISIVDDATLSSFNGEPLRGFYEYDDEGVKVRPVTLVENGILRGFLMSSSPINGFPTSNGHGRAELGALPVARMGVTRLMASQTVSYDELEKKLLAEIRAQHKPYGYIIDDLSGGFTMTDTFFPQVFKLEPKLVYRLYPDGRKEVVRGAEIVGTPLVSFSQILAAANDDAVFNGTCGAESGWVPVSAIAPSVLIRSLEIEKTGKSNFKPPLLPPPYALQGEKK
ncbi:metallopeptidase TldD-related protein [Candidatus Avelusimicrobium luingense]|uniref:metallopeptidase TldD-related protein n=1 Tax=Candidatus Avelusimicrobium luingense TaxID=3416211 RepID=UPI003D0B5862